MIPWPPEMCPVCKNNKNLQHHTKTTWCSRCGWAKNRYPDPQTNKTIERRFD